MKAIGEVLAVILALVLMIALAPIWAALIVLGALRQSLPPVSWRPAPSVAPARLGPPRAPLAPPVRRETWFEPSGWRPYQWPPEGMILTLVGQEAEAAAAAGLPTEWFMPGGDRYYLRDVTDEPAPLPKLAKLPPRLPTHKLPDDNLPF
jgi:hypothetical protein